MKKSILLIGISSMLTCRGMAQQISYMLPDAAAPGMPLYTEIIGPNAQGNFGDDGVNKINLEFIHPEDSSRVVVGPRVTSWDGRMVSVFLLVQDRAATGAIPFRLRSGSTYSNVDTFFVMQPQRLPNGLAAGALGSGGSYGTRSRRNTMVVESLSLGAGTFTVSDLDPDPYTPGNQAYLPFTIVSKGPVTIAGTLSVNGTGIDGIAGGGGGGARDKYIGGAGYTGGGGIHNHGGPGSGSDYDGFNGGSSLCSTPGGIGLGLRYFDDQGGGGGTGFPFGRGGLPGTWYQEGGDNPPGGIGGGSGGGEKSMPDSSFGGGGGGFAYDGQNSGTSGPNGGLSYGNVLLIPFCGGSGGGGGNQYGDGQAGSGGAGGGAIHIISASRIDVHGNITANGADGEGTQRIFKGGGGGAGSGGAIALSAPLVNLDGRLSVEGGKGGDAVLQYEQGGLYGGDGSEGRIRVVGLLAALTQQIPPYSGPSKIEFKSTNGIASLKGHGYPGDSIIIFAQGGGSNNVLKTEVLEGGMWSVTCPPSIASAAYFTTLEQVHYQDPTTKKQVAMWVMSPRSVASTADAAAATEQSSRTSPLTVSVPMSNTSAQSPIATITGAAQTRVQISLVDLLGRVCIRTTIVLDADGRSAWNIPSQGLASGAYILLAQSANETSSRTLAISR